MTAKMNRKAISKFSAFDCDDFDLIRLRFSNIIFIMTMIKVRASLLNQEYLKCFSVRRVQLQSPGLLSLETYLYCGLFLRVRNIEL